MEPQQNSTNMISGTQLKKLYTFNIERKYEKVVIDEAFLNHIIANYNPETIEEASKIVNETLGYERENTNPSYLRFKNKFFEARAKTITRQIIQVQPQVENILLESTTTMNNTEIIQQSIQPTIIQSLNLNSAIKSVPKILLNKYKPKMTDTGVTITISSKHNNKTIMKNCEKSRKCEYIGFTKEELINQLHKSNKPLNIKPLIYGDSNFQSSSNYNSNELVTSLTNYKNFVPIDYSREELLAFYNQQKFVYVSCSIGWDIKSQKKDCRGRPNGWNKITSPLYDPLKPSLCILTGKVSNLLIIDFDDIFDSANIDKSNELLLQCFRSNTLCTKTKKGYHFWYKYSDKLLAKTNVGKLKFDLLIEDSKGTANNIYVPPSSYDIIDEHSIFKQTQHYKFVTELIEPIELPESIIQWIIKEDPATDVKHKKQQLTTTVKVQSSKVKDYNRDSILSLLKIIKHMNQQYDSWTKVALALHHINPNFLDVLQEWSQINYTKYDPYSVEAFWSKIIDSSNNPLTLGSIKKWAKDHDEIAYNEWRSLYKDRYITDLICNFHQSNIAKYYHYNTKNYIMVLNSKWYKCDRKTKLWDKLDDDKSMMMPLHNFINKKLIKEKKHRQDLCKQLKDKPDKTDDELSFLNSIESLLNMIDYASKHIGSTSLLDGVIKQMKVLFTKRDIEFDSSINLLSFNNGVYELDTGIFREERKPEDYLTQTLKYDFSEVTNDSLIDEIKSNVFRNDEELVKFFAYCMTGLIKHKKNIFFHYGITHTGKSALADIYEKVLPIYCDKIENNAIKRGYQYIHKQLGSIKNTCRLLRIDELIRETIETDFLKDIADGRYKINKMYSEAQMMDIRFKLYITTNNSLKFKPDSGFDTRCLYLESRKQYLPTDSDFEDVRLKFDDLDYKLAYIHLLLPYAKLAFESMSERYAFPELNRNFIEVSVERDRFKQMYDDQIEETNDTNHRLTPNDISRLYGQLYNVTISRETVLSEMKRIGKGSRYVKDKRVLGVGRSGEKGIYEGIRFNQNNQNEPLQNTTTTNTTSSPSTSK